MDALGDELYFRVEPILLDMGHRDTLTACKVPSTDGLPAKPPA
jgi:hypothetical protein